MVYFYLKLIVEIQSNFICN